MQSTDHLRGLSAANPRMRSALLGALVAVSLASGSPVMALADDESAQNDSMIPVQSPQRMDPLLGNRSAEQPPDLLADGVYVWCDPDGLWTIFWHAQDALQLSFSARADAPITVNRQRDPAVRFAQDHPQELNLFSESSFGAMHFRSQAESITVSVLIDGQPDPARTFILAENVLHPDDTYSISAQAPLHQSTLVTPTDDHIGQPIPGTAAGSGTLARADFGGATTLNEARQFYLDLPGAPIDQLAAICRDVPNAEAAAFLAEPILWQLAGNEYCDTIASGLSDPELDMATKSLLAHVARIHLSHTCNLTPLLIPQALQETNPLSFRIACISTLSASTQSEALSQLVPLLDSPSPSIRRATIYTLARHPVPVDYDTLLTTESDSQVLQAIFHAISQADVDLQERLTPRITSIALESDDPILITAVARSLLLCSNSESDVQLTTLLPRVPPFGHALLRHLCTQFNRRDILAILPAQSIFSGEPSPDGPNDLGDLQPGDIIFNEFAPLRIEVLPGASNIGHVYPAAYRTQSAWK